MSSEPQNNLPLRQISCRQLAAADFNPLLIYLQHLSTATKSRFGPHAFDAAAVINFYNDISITGYVAEDASSHSIIAYAIIKKGILVHDYERLKQYGTDASDKSYCTFAPSVADHWQGKGIGKMLFEFILSDIATKGLNKIMLWGGVQASNQKALQFYSKAGFKTLGSFEYNGLNLDMLLQIETQ